MINKNEKQEKQSKELTTEELAKINDMNITEKLYSIQSEVTEVLRTKKNKRLFYSFFNELQVLKMLRPLIKKYKLLFSMSDDPTVGFKWQQLGNLYIVEYLKKLEVSNVRVDKEIETKTFSFWAVGSNTDPAKAKGAAETYSIKYMLTKFFTIPVEDETDPDYGTHDEVKKEDNNKDSNKKAVVLNEKTQKLYDLFVEVRGNSTDKQSIDRQKQLLFELDKIIVGIDKYKLDTSTIPSNFRERLNLLDDEDYKKYWDCLESNKNKTK